MSCQINGCSLSKRLDDTMNRISQFDDEKNVILASLLKDEGFNDYLKKFLKESDGIDGQKIDLSKLSKDDYDKINQNKFGKIWNMYYHQKYASVSESATNSGLSTTNGFSSVAAKKVAKDHTGDLLVEEYYASVIKGEKRGQETSVRILNRVEKRITNKFFNDYANPFIESLVAEDSKASATAKEEAQEYLNLVQSINDLTKKLYGTKETQGLVQQLDSYKRVINQGKNELNKLQEELQKLDKKENKTEDEKKRATELENQIRKLSDSIKNAQEQYSAIDKEVFDSRNRLLDMSMNQYISAQNIINEYASTKYGIVATRAKNYANLIQLIKTDPDAWFFQVFNTKKMTNIVKDFNKIKDIESEMESVDDNEAEIISQYTSEGFDETVKTWEDYWYNNSLQSIGERVKLELSLLPVLSGKVTTNDVNGIANTNNELGVSTHADPTFLIANIHSKKNVTDVASFIKSLEDMGDSVEELYNLKLLANDLKQNPLKANAFFVAFAKPLVHKTMVTITDSHNGGIAFDYSNNRAFAKQAMFYDFREKLRATYKNAYDIVAQRNIKGITKIRSNSKNLKAAQNYMFDVLRSFFPRITEVQYENVINAADDSGTVNVAANMRQLARILDRIFDDAAEMNKKLTEAFENAKKNKNGERVDYSSIEFSSKANSDIDQLCELFIKYNPSRIQLNSPNAEGNSNGNVMKNCFITRFFDDILSDDKDVSDRGLQNLLDYITQGTDDELNQYSFNPLFFGVQHPTEPNSYAALGMFSRDGNGNVSINKDAKNILRYSLFDGTQNRQNRDGNTYASMSELDFAVSQYIAFIKPTKEWNTTIDRKTGDETSRYTDMIDPFTKAAIYSMRIPSDAPKIFMIRAPRYNRVTAKQAIYQHVMNEINMFAKGLNSVFEQEGNGYRLVQSLDGLYDRTHYDEDGETIQDKLVDEDGKLRGSLFSFGRLFTTTDGNGHLLDYGESIEKILFGQKATVDVLLNAMNVNNENSVLAHKDAVDGVNGRIYFELNAEQEKALKDLIDGWCNSFLRDAMIESYDYINTLKNMNEYNEDDYQDFLLNSYIMNMNYDDLFEGDRKFYKNSRDFLKRTKEAQSGGEGYASYDTKDGYLQNGTDILQRDGKDCNIEITDKKGNVIYSLQARKGFNGVTINDSRASYDKAEQIGKDLYEKYKKEGLSDETAKRLSDEIKKPYLGKTTINDAQSYITLDEFIRRRWADGTLEEYMPLLQQLLDPNISVYDIDMKAVTSRIQVGKNFYYDKIYDSNTGLFVPRQIKNAELVLIPKLLPEGSELKQVAEWMENNNISQLNTVSTSKAANRDVYTLFNENGTLNEASLQGNIDSKYVQNYSYMYLYKQQDTQQHIENEKNKAGTQFMKKILDNASIGSEDTKLAIREFQEAYTFNIQEDFNRFLDVVGWKISNNVDIINKENENEKITFERFYTRAREECARLGMDSNFIEYFTPDPDTGKPTMPNYLNVSARKLESVAQALFNKSITRQTLPGWHAVQVSKVGYSNNLKMNAENGVMEVMLPRWSSLIPRGKNAAEDAAILAQIQKEGLDIQIGYRIPTEGKQSISILRVVGFVPDAYGSTIIVPNEWVTQTGSDFDIDTIYGIAWEMYSTIGKNGVRELHKVPYEKIDDETLYIQYVKNKLNDATPLDELQREKASKIRELNDKAKNSQISFIQKNEAYKKLDAERNDLFKQMPKWARGAVRTSDGKYEKTKINKRDKHSLTESRQRNKQRLMNVYADQIEVLRGLVDKIDNGTTTRKDLISTTSEELEAIKKYIDVTSQQLDVMKLQDDVYSFADKRQDVSEIVKTAKQDIFRVAKQIVLEANDNTFMTFEEFCKQSPVAKLDRRARNNYILDRAQKIMSDPAYREEQYSTSNFKDIAAAKQEVMALMGINEENQSPYNVLTQLSYFGDVMGGARMKAMSVNWDTFVSKNNMIHAELTEGWQVRLYLPEEANARKIALDELRLSYGDDITEIEGKNYVLFEAKKLGFSNNDRNVSGKLVTVYTSQTTAHHLDAVKEGSIKNVTEYTFPVYKMISSLGLTHSLAVKFIMQPGISRIIANQNIINSLFTKQSNNPTKMALIDVLENIGVAYREGENKPGVLIGSYPTMDGIMEAILADNENANNLREALKEICGPEIFDRNKESGSFSNFHNFRLPLDERMFEERLKGTLGSYILNKNDFKNAAIDIATILTFMNMKRDAQYMDNRIQALTIDKVGAKPTIFENRRVIERIDELRRDDGFGITREVLNTETGEIEKEYTSLMNAVFPMEGGVVNERKSAYPSIAAIYKYVTNISTAVNSLLFTTECDEFWNRVKTIELILGRKLNHDEYVQFRNYVVSSMFNEIDKFLTPLALDERGNICMDPDWKSNYAIITDDSNNKRELQYWDAERTRIYGYNEVRSGDFDIDDVSKPTEEDIDRFRQLTPAQKVLFIQKHFDKDCGVFGSLNITLANNTMATQKGVTRQYIAYDDQTDDVETLQFQFEQAFSNKNPLIKLAAIDLVKYAFIAEGFNYRNGYVSKIVPNSIISDGMRLVGELNRKMNDLIVEERGEDNKLINTIFHNFVRSHPQVATTYYLNDEENAAFLRNIDNYDQLVSFDIVRLSQIKKNHGENVAKSLQNVVQHLHLDKHAGGYINVRFKQPKPVGDVKYVNEVPIVTTKIQSVNVLYQVIGKNFDKDGNCKDYYLIPLNKLDYYENYEYSYNKGFNEFNEYDYYKEIIESLAENANNFRIDEKSSRLSVTRTKSPVGDFKGNMIDFSSDPNAFMSLREGTPYISEGVKKMLNTYRTFLKYNSINSPGGCTIYQPFQYLSRFIGRGESVEQVITDQNGMPMRVKITHMKNTKKFVNNIIKSLYDQSCRIENMSFFTGENGVTKENTFDVVQSTLMKTSTNETLETRILSMDFWNIVPVKATTEEQEDGIMKSVTDISDIDIEDIPLFKFGKKSQPELDFDTAASTMLQQIRRNATRNRNIYAQQYMRKLETTGLNIYNNQSIGEHREDVFKYAANYFEAVKNELIHQLENFQLGPEGEMYRIDDPKLYEALGEYDEYFNKLAKVLLDAITFGDRIQPLMNMMSVVEDKEILANITRIRSAIDAIKGQNAVGDMIRKGFDNMVNIYFKRFSTNPLVYDDIIKLRDQFGDISAYSKWILDPIDINHNEVQVVLKQMYSVFAKAEMFDAGRNVRMFDETIKKIMEETDGDVDWNKIIDDYNGRLRQDFDEQFETDKGIVSRVAAQTKELFLSDPDNDRLARNYVLTKLARDKWYAEHTQQEYVDAYYDRDVSIREKAMNEADDFFIEYIKLQNKVFGNTYNQSALSEEEIRGMKQQMQMLASPEFFDNDEDKKKARALSEYIKARRELNEQYFTYEEFANFKKDFEKYNTFINEFDNNHKDMPLSEKLQNTQYNEAYDWIKRNGSVRFTPEGSAKLSKCFTLLTKKANYYSKAVRKLANSIPGGVDAFGVIDGRVFNDAQIDQLRDEEENDLAKMYNDNMGELIPIKLTSMGSKVILRKSHPDPVKNAVLKKYSDRTSPDLDSDKIKEKMEIIGDINFILKKALNTNGSINLEKLFDDDYVTETERKDLIRLFDKLRNYVVDGSKISMRTKGTYKTEIYRKGLDGKLADDYATQMEGLVSSKKVSSSDQTIFNRIFFQYDEKLGIRLPNEFLFGYKEIVDDSFIDTERTEAADWLNENVEYQTTDYYKMAAEQAQKEGRYTEWFYKNHIYNPFTHTYQPLKIWNKLASKKASWLESQQSYQANGEHKLKTIKPEYKNKNFSEFGSNYKESSDGRYRSDVQLNDKERKIRDFMQETLNKFATDYTGRKFVGRGFLPRERHVVENASHMINQGLGLLGLNWHTTGESDAFYKDVDYAHDKEQHMNMLSLLRAKGTQQYEKYPARGDMTEEDYTKACQEIDGKNEEIRRKNMEIDHANRNSDWEGIMRDFVHNATIFNARQSMKPMLQLLLEDLRNHDAYKLKNYQWNDKLVKSNESTEDYQSYETEKQERAADVIENIIHRLMYDQFHEPGKLRSGANMLQNLASAKFMIGNFYGGINNVTIGLTNIAMESAAKEYFGGEQWREAEWDYLTSIAPIIGSAFTDQATDKVTALIKKFNVIDMDQFLQYGAAGESLDEFFKKVREFSYGFQSMGEHFMQNCGLLAMLKSNRLYKNSDGKWEIGDFKDYTRRLERQAMLEVLKNRENLLTLYNNYIKNLNKDTQAQVNLVTGVDEINRKFLYQLRDARGDDGGLYKEISHLYYEKRKELTENAREEFEKNTKIEDMFEYQEGVNGGDAVIKEQYYEMFADYDREKGYSDELEYLIGKLKKKIEAVNKKIHGVYDKEGAAYLERKFFGSLVMQYHKHLPWGILKHWRRRGYWSEFRNSNERGMFQTALDFLCADFTNFKKRRVAVQEENQMNACYASLQVTLESLVNTMYNFQTNWENLSDSERSNIKRLRGEAKGTIMAMLTAGLIHTIFDDDEITDDGVGGWFLSSAMRIVDRQYSEATMYSIPGLYSEYLQTYNSPIAGSTELQDLFEIGIQMPRYIWDPEYRVYKNGAYKGEDRMKIRILRGLPITRQYVNLHYIRQNHTYYKVGESQVGLNAAIKLGDLIGGHQK